MTIERHDTYLGFIKKTRELKPGTEEILWRYSWRTRPGEYIQTSMVVVSPDMVAIKERILHRFTEYLAGDEINQRNIQVVRNLVSFMVGRNTTYSWKPST